MSIIAVGGFLTFSIIAAGVFGDSKFRRMSSRRQQEENPGCCSINRGLSLAAPIEDLQVSESHPAMIGAGCPLLPRGVFLCFGPTSNAS
jgi:hypothetical protein